MDSKESGHRCRAAGSIDRDRAAGEAMRAAALVDPSRAGWAGVAGSAHGLHVVRRGDTLYGIGSPPGEPDVATLAPPEQHGGRRSDPRRPASRVSSRASRSRSRWNARQRQQRQLRRPPGHLHGAPGDTLYGIARCCRSRCATCWAGTASPQMARSARAEKLVAFVNGRG